MAENRIIDARRTILALMQTSDQTRREREAWAALAPSSRRRYRSALRKLRSWTEQHAAGAASGPRPALRLPRSGGRGRPRQRPPDRPLRAHLLAARRRAAADRARSNGRALSQPPT